MKKIRFVMLAGIIIVSVLGTLLHFAYGWSGENAIVGLFTPVNESTWEHMKLLFFPMLLFSFYANRTLKKEYPCIGSAMALGTLIGTLLIPVLFYTYSGALGYNVAIADIATFFISVIAAFFVVYKATLSCSVDSYKEFLDILLFAFAVLFIVFSVFPPDIALFRSP